MRHARTLIAIAMLACGPAVAAQAAKPAPGQAQADVVSGGIGLDARDELAAKARDHNLKLVFALATREYLSDVDVRIADAKGREVAAQRSEGPWLFAKLPPGNYTVSATSNGNTITKKVSVGGKGQKVVNFLWPASGAETGAGAAAPAHR